MELERELKSCVNHLLMEAPDHTLSLKTGCDLFMKFVTRTFLDLSVRTHVHVWEIFPYFVRTPFLVRYIRPPYAKSRRALLFLTTLHVPRKGLRRVVGRSLS